MTFAIQIIVNTPLCVWPLLALALWGGLRATRDRETALWGLYLIPVFGVLALMRVAQADPMAWPFFGVLYLTFAALGWRAQSMWVIWKRDGRARLKGEWLTFFKISVLCAVGYVGGVLDAIAPEVSSAAWYVAAETMIGASASGAFIGRALFLATLRPRPA
ncbi:MAG: hypothetical protein AAF401_01055 [Pseudomonadota bacterium]